MATILDYYDWCRCDMIYGIGEQINAYISYLWKNGKLGGNMTSTKYKTDRYVAINTFNRAFAKGDFTLNGSNIEVDLAKIKNQSLNVDTQTSNIGRTEDYIDRLMKSKQSPSTLSGNPASNPKLLGALQKGRDDLTAASSQSDLLAAARELAIRRSCKFGIEYALSHSSSPMIHYVLDGMDMLKVATKEWFDKTIPKSGGSITFRKVSICTSELRYLFRNWGRISLTGRIKFYYNYTEIVPPWTDAFFKSAQQWAEYAQRMATKHLGTPKDAPVLDLYKAKKWAETVAKYFELTPTLVA
jgi:hypothetical protein